MIFIQDYLLDNQNITTYIDHLRDLVPFVQFKKREIEERSVTFSKVAGWSLQFY